jgi:hypothetical protein
MISIKNAILRTMKNTDVDRVLWKKLDDDCAEKINGGLLTITSINFLGNNSGTQKNVAVLDNDRAFVFQLNSFGGL